MNFNLAYMCKKSGFENFASTVKTLALIHWLKDSAGFLSINTKKRR